MTRARLARPVVVTYWGMLLAGLVFYTAIRIDDARALLPLWIGAVGGTVLGQFLALHAYRLWVAIALIVAVLTWCAPSLPPEISSTELWMAFVPAALCGFFGLSDRASLAAFWFPAVIWMLSILDHTGGQTTPDGAGIVLLGALAVLFLVFLRARESRRVALWRTIAATPLATARPSVVLKEPPGRQLARGGWALLVSTITFGVTSWIAPHLWQTESFDGGEIAAADPAPTLGLGLPCCPATWDAALTRSRVTEYFDIGRGHDELAEPPRTGIDCRVCQHPALAEAGAAGSLEGVIAGGGSIGGRATASEPRVPGVPGSRASARWGGRYASGQIDGDAPWPPSPSAAVPSVAPSPEPPAGALAPGAPATDPTAIAPAASPPLEVPAPATPEVDPLPLPPPPPEALPAPELAPPPVLPVQPPPAIASTTPPVNAGALPVTPAPSAASSFRPHRPAAAGLGPELLHGIAVILAAALLFQLTGLALRPLRRWITLRHLRRPFWDETIDQRVSNSWQLALVGLRDAGWRSTPAEAPREFAHRAGVEGLERCATILERARHGIAIDAGDLSEMTASADTAYRSARRGIRPLARAMAWLRWPLT